jgi:thiamine-monophosphate kinase
MMEAELIAHLRRRIGPHPLVRLGIGDDAAVLDMAATDQCVLTVDLLTEGVDFVLREVDPRRIGRKALAVNLSDLAAMASQPLAGVVALALPRRGGLDLAVALYEGMLPLAEDHGLAIAGGDTNSWDGPLVISVTLLGKVTSRGPLTRRGARPGDHVVVTGVFGGSILGHQFDFEPRTREALALAERYDLHAGIDVSDGLSLDLARLCAESDCGAVIEAGQVPVSPDAGRLAASSADGLTALDHALGDGEDFELILAAPPGEAERMIAEQPCNVRLTRIGRFVSEHGLKLAEPGGRQMLLTPRGFQHEFD